MAKSDTIYNSGIAELYTNSPSSADLLIEFKYYNHEDYDALYQDFEYKCTSGTVVVTTKIYDSDGVLQLTDTNTLAAALTYTAITQNSIAITDLSDGIYKLTIEVQGTGVYLQFINQYLK